MTIACTSSDGTGATPRAEAVSKAARLPGYVLIVDDTEDSRDLLVHMVQKIGYRATAVEGGKEALQRLAGGEFDLVLLDIMMPQMNGYEVLERMKADPELQKVPVVAVSALTEVESVVAAMRQGADDYLFKPVSAVLVRSRLEAVLEKKRLRDSERASLAALRAEREKVEELLLRLYPLSVANRLKAGEGIIADAYPEATILMANVCDFHRVARTRAPTEVVRLLGDVFSTFDGLCRQFGVEKIKVMGDTYMAAAGIGTGCRDDADAVADLAIRMQREGMQFSGKLGEGLSLRIGIHSGPVVAGVIGTAKGTFDLWGAAVKVAGQMEATGLVGGIQVSETAYRLLRAGYLFEPRGTFYVSGEGEVTTYLLKGKKGGNA